jgi:hypothetical protein
MTTKCPKCFVFAFTAGILGETEALGILNPASGQGFHVFVDYWHAYCFGGGCPDDPPWWRLAEALTKSESQPGRLYF